MKHPFPSEPSLPPAPGDNSLAEQPPPLAPAHGPGDGSLDDTLRTCAAELSGPLTPPPFGTGLDGAEDGADPWGPDFWSEGGQEMPFVSYLGRVLLCSGSALRFLVRVFGEVTTILVGRLHGFDW